MATTVPITVSELPQHPANAPQTGAVLGAIVFGSDQGLVGRFNDVIAEHAIQVLAALPGTPKVWAVGERVHMQLADAGLTVVGSYPLPNTVETIAPFVSQMQMDSEEHRAANGYQPLYVFHNRPQSGSQYAPSHQQLLPLDAAWKKSLEATRPWPNKVVPQVMGSSTTALRALLSEHLFISLFRACAESLASENASRLSAMDRADKNIQELLVTLNNTLHTQRQRAIDEELFDVISGYEALSSAG
jgi:F-type H+-transporting ATPase subunit gamma